MLHEKLKKYWYKKPAGLIFPVLIFPPNRTGGSNFHSSHVECFSDLSSPPSMASPPPAAAAASSALATADSQCRTTKPGSKRFVLTLTILLSFLAGEKWKIKKKYIRSFFSSSFDRLSRVLWCWWRFGRCSVSAQIDGDIPFSSSLSWHWFLVQASRVESLPLPFSIPGCSSWIRPGVWSDWGRKFGSVILESDSRFKQRRIGFQRFCGVWI